MARAVTLNDHRATNLLIAGLRVVVAGYGWCAERGDARQGLAPRNRYGHQRSPRG